ncbi:hypothetical protein MPSEU_000172200 [Mayamaea pseudoterrestris]|nr:hypothetical protein MPSEU_000172200 [Mayamaea pseudoterrestris]
MADSDAKVSKGERFQENESETAVDIAETDSVTAATRTSDKVAATSISDDSKDDQLSIIDAGIPAGSEFLPSLIPGVTRVYRNGILPVDDAASEAIDNEYDATIVNAGPSGQTNLVNMKTQACNDFESVFEGVATLSNHSVAPFNIESVPSRAVEGIYVKRQRLIAYVAALVCLLLFAALSIGLTSQPVAPVSNMPHSFFAMPSTVEKLAMSLPESTVNMIRNELSADTRASAIWYMDKAWASQDAEFQPASPQGKAWKWIMTHTNLHNGSLVAITDMFALVVLYYATDGPQWKNSTNWLNAEEDYRCSWWFVDTTRYYVVSHEGRCQPDGKDGIEYIDLSNNGLVGRIPLELSLITTLRYIKLSGNALFGEIDETLWRSWKDASILLLEGNQFSGSIPNIVGMYTNMGTMYLGKNRFSGSLPSALFQLPSLVLMDLSNNALTGQITLSSKNDNSILQNLNLTQNSFNGTLPSAIGKLTMLQFLSLSSNVMSGTLPSQISLCTALHRIDMFNNTRLSGTLPSQLQRLSDLVFLRMSNTSLSGTLPSQAIARLTSLASLDVSGTRTEGTLPSEFAQLSRLGSLRIYDTNMTGSIPSSVCDMFLSQDATEGIVVDCSRVQCSCNCTCIMLYNASTLVTRSASRRMQTMFRPPALMTTTTTNRAVPFTSSFGSSSLFSTKAPRNDASNVDVDEGVTVKATGTPEVVITMQQGTAQASSKAVSHDSVTATANDEDEQEEMFVEPHDDFTFRTKEWGGPRRGGRFMEPTRFGDWERKGRCSDF